MKYFILIIVFAFLSFQGIAQERTQVDTIFFEYNAKYLKEHAIDNGNKKDRFYLKSNPQTYGTIYFEVQDIKTITKSQLELVDLEKFLITNDLLYQFNYVMSLLFLNFRYGKSTRI